MMEKITPSEYLKLARQDFKNLPADVCDDLLKQAHNSEGGWNILYILESIPKKYHARMQAVWAVMVFKILFTNATHKYTLLQRHKMLSDALKYTGNVRESAGR